MIDKVLSLLQPKQTPKKYKRPTHDFLCDCRNCVPSMTRHRKQFTQIHKEFMNE